MNSITSLFISNALAQDVTSAAVASPPSSGLMGMLPIVLICLVIYFIMVIPQQRKMKEHKNKINNLKINDKICTTSGIFGVVKEIDLKENFIEVEIAKDVVVKVLRSSISDIIQKKEEKEVKVNKVTKVKKSKK